MPSYLIIAFTVSFGVSVLLVLTQKWHGRFSMDPTHGVQKFHTKATPRIGGIGLAAGLVSAWAFCSAEVAALLQPMLLAALPAFAAGMIEDITKKVGVATRLLATMVSGALAWWLTGIALNRVDVLLVDDLLALPPVAVLFTIFAVAGVANAINIIDGFNGLAGGTLLMILAAMGSIAYTVGDLPLALACAAVAATVLGFLLVNFPLGKLFLGDGGAYLAGFVLAWLAVLLLVRHPGISPWTALLANAYPVTEVLYSVWRRWRTRCSSGAPDRQHLHSLIKTQILRRYLPHWSSRRRNAAVSPIMWTFASVPAALAVALHNAPVWAPILALAGFVLWYHLSYCYLAARQQAEPIFDNSVLLPDCEH